MKLNLYLLRSIIVGALGGLLFGFDTAVIAGTTHSLSRVYSLTAEQLGFTVASALIGTVIGSMLAGIPGEKLGGRESLRIMAVLYIVSAVGCAAAWNWPMLVLFRFIGGLGIGGSSVIGPVYIAELAPARLRGRLVAIFQINIVIGILLAYLSNYLIGLAGFGLNEWRVQLGIAGIPAVLFLVMLFGIPRSPRWLVTRDMVDEARVVLTTIGEENVESELKDIAASVHLGESAQTEPLFQWKYRTPIFLAVSVAFFNQTAGINAILYYSNYIFEQAGYTKVSGDLQSVAVGFMNLIATLFAMTLIDRLGRKTLLLIGSVGMTACLLGVAYIFRSREHLQALLWLLVVYIAFFAISQGAVIWVFISEVFPNKVRAKGQSLGSSTHWVMNALISAVFPAIAQRSQTAPFVFFAAMMVLQFFVVSAFYPETKGITLEAMQHKLGVE
jgi:SP family arabinose:H+ symporter-like MFS transporter